MVMRRESDGMEREEMRLGVRGEWRRMGLGKWVEGVFTNGFRLTGVLYSYSISLSVRIRYATRED